MKIIDKILDGLSNTFLPSSNERLKVVVLCIVAATTFWFFNALNDNYTTRIKYPIKITYPDSVYVAVNELPEQVMINVTGGGWNLLRKTFGITVEAVEIPLSEPSERNYILGPTLYPLISDQLSEIQLNFIETDSIKIEIDSIQSKKAKIKVDSTKIALKEGFRITSKIDISPDSAEFTGPARFITQIPDVIWLEIKKTGISSNHNSEMELSTYGSNLVNRNPVEVEVGFEVSKFIEQEHKVPFNTVNDPSDSANYIFLDSLAQINFHIEESKADKLNLDSVRLQVDYRKMQKNDSTVRPEIVELPALLRNKEIQVDSVRYYYKSE